MIVDSAELQFGHWIGWSVHVRTGRVAGIAVTARAQYPSPRTRRPPQHAGGGVLALYGPATGGRLWYATERVSRSTSTYRWNRPMGPDLSPRHCTAGSGDQGGVGPRRRLIGFWPCSESMTYFFNFGRIFSIASR